MGFWAVLYSKVGGKALLRVLPLRWCRRIGFYSVVAFLIAGTSVFSAWALSEEGGVCPKIGGSGQSEKSYELKIEQSSLVYALLELARQTELELFYPHELAEIEGDYRIDGAYSITQALCGLLNETAYFGNLTESGVITISHQNKTREEIAVKKSKKGLLAALIGLFTATGGQVGNTAEEQFVIEEVVVTATKRSSTAQDVGVALSVISQSALEIRGDINVDSLADMVPGLEIVNNGPGNNQVVMRGVGTLGGGFQSVSSVGYYLDETPMSAFTELPEVGLYDVAQVEVLRGPQGTLFGDGSMGGTIRVITNKPDSSAFSGDLVVNGSSTTDGGTSQSYRGMINIPLVEDVLALRAVVGYKDEDGWIDVPALDKKDVNENQILDTRIALRWTPSEALTADLTYFHNDLEIAGDFAETGGRGVFDPQAIQPFAGDPSEIGTQDSEYDLFTLTVDYDLGFANLVSATSFFDMESAFVLGLSEFSPLFFGVPGTIRQIAPDTTQEVLIQELRLVSNSEEAFRWTVGGFYKDVERFGFEDFQISLPLFGIIDDSSNSSLDFESTSYALFAEFEYDLSADVTLIAGGRYFDTEHSYVTQPLAASLIFGGDPTVINPKNEATEDNFSPKLGLKWQLNDELLLIANISEGFRSGGVNTNARNPGQVDPGDTRLSIPAGFESETVRAYEIGFKSNPTNTLQINGYVYLNQWEDLHLGEATTDGLFGFTSNAGEAETTGVELELLTMPMDGLVLSVNTAYTDATIQDDVFNAVGGLTIKGGNEIPFVPKFTLSASATYSFPLVGNYTGIAYANYTHRDENFSDAENVPEEINPDSDRVNIRLGMESNVFGVYFYVNNLFDEEVTTFRNNVVEAVPMVYNSYVRPRTVGLELKLSFDG